MRRRGKNFGEETQLVSIILPKTVKDRIDKAAEAMRLSRGRYLMECFFAYSKGGQGQLESVETSEPTSLPTVHLDDIVEGDAVPRAEPGDDWKEMWLKDE